MADKPHRAIVLFGDGLLLDNTSNPSLASEPWHSTTIEAANCPSLHDTARRGVSGFLALRETSQNVSEGERIVLELAQLLDVAGLYSPGACLADCGLREGSNKGTDGLEGSMDQAMPSLAQRFMNLGALMVTSTAPAAALGRRAGFSVVPFQESSPVDPSNPTPWSSSAANEAQAESRHSTLPEAKATAEKLVKLLGLDKVEDRMAPPPSAAERSEDEFELALVHVTPDDFARAGRGPLGAAAETGANLSQASEAAAERTSAEAPSGAELDGTDARDHGAKEQSSETRQEEGTTGPAREGALQGSGSKGGVQDSQAQWAAAVRGLEWLSSLVESLRDWQKPESKAASHMLVILLLGYGRQGVGSMASGSGANGELPGVTALQPVPGSVPPALAAVRPRQSYRLKEDKEVEDVREHHPLLAVYQLDAVTRCDDARGLGVRECRERGGNLAILAERFLHEVTFKLWRTPKYGA